MNIIELVQKIGNEVCDGCDDDRDCGLELDECPRIFNAVDLVEKFIDEGSS